MNGNQLKKEKIIGILEKQLEKDIFLEKQLEKFGKRKEWNEQLNKNLNGILIFKEFATIQYSAFFRSYLR